MVHFTFDLAAVLHLNFPSEINTILISYRVCLSFVLVKLIHTIPTCISVHFSDILCVRVTWYDLRESPGLTVIQPLFILLFMNWIIATVNTVCLVCTAWICSCCVCYCVCQHTVLFTTAHLHTTSSYCGIKGLPLFFFSLFHIRHEIFSVTKEDLLWLQTVNIAFLWLFRHFHLESLLK